MLSVHGATCLWLALVSRDNLSTTALPRRRSSLKDSVAGRSRMQLFRVVDRRLASPLVSVLPECWHLRHPWA